MSRAPKFLNFMQNLAPSKWVSQQIGMVDAPNLSSPTLDQGLSTRSMEAFDLNAIQDLSEDVKARSVILVQDAFSSYYDADLVLAFIDVLTRLDVRVYVAPFLPNGKPMHIKGFMDRFKAVAQTNTEALKSMEETGVPLVGLEPSMALTYREEYPEILGQNQKVTVHLAQEWLSSYLRNKKDLKAKVLHPEMTQQVFSLFGHCTEKTSAAASQRQWKEAFEHFGLHLELQSTGCCGMAGTYGHETLHVEESKALFEMSWKPKLESAIEKGQQVLATGFSCRCQTKRYGGFKPQHPIQVLQLATRP
jgi:Fe-S oxidoreductase